MALKDSLLIDVRTPTEFLTGALPGAVNIEYQNISNYIVDLRSLDKDADIMLYCRSGRRSAIAKAELDTLGYTRVRDIGSLEDAARVLEQEEKIVESGAARKEGSVITEDLGVKGVEKARLEKSTAALLDGLRACS